MTLSFIILNYNTSLQTLNCVKSIIDHAPNTSYEIIVVDNNSNKEEWETLNSLLQDYDLNIIKSRINLGFGAGNVLGANFANGDFLCFLNSDIIFTEDCITPLIEYLNRHNDIGCITPQQYNRNNIIVPSFNHDSGITEELFGKELLETLFSSKYPKRKNTIYKKPFSVKQINGCFMIFPKNIFWEVGGFDQNIFLYYEELDICYRLKEKGYKSVVYPNCRFSHLHGESTKKAHSNTVRELYISKMYCYRKYHNIILSSCFRIINIIKLMTKPNKWYILPVVLRGESSSKSMRHNRL